MNLFAYLMRRPTRLAIATVLVFDASRASSPSSIRGRRASVLLSSRVGAVTLSSEFDQAELSGVPTAPHEGERRFDGTCCFFGVVASL
jgi:hypothetical protein